MPKKKEFDIKEKRQEVSKKHIEFYDELLNSINFILTNYVKELRSAQIEFLNMPKTSIATLDFLISSIVKIQKGQRIALGLDEEEYVDTSPIINIIKGLDGDKI